MSIILDKPSLFMSTFTQGELLHLNNGYTGHTNVDENNYKAKYTTYKYIRNQIKNNIALD